MAASARGVNAILWKNGSTWIIEMPNPSTTAPAAPARATQRSRGASPSGSPNVRYSANRPAATRAYCVIWYCGDNSASEGPLLGGGLVGDDARALIEAGQGLTAAEYVAARNRGHEIAAAWAAFHARYDLLLTPTMECVAFPLSDWAPRELDGQPIGEFYDDYCHFCYPFNLTGQPVISVPMAPGSGGLPLGLQIAGRRFEDDLVLRAAAAWERAQPWETASLPPSASRPLPAELAAALAAGESVATIPGAGAWSLAAPVRAGELFALPGGGHVRAVRAWSPRAGELEVSFRLEA